MAKRKRIRRAGGLFWMGPCPCGCGRCRMLILNEKQTKRLAVIEWPLNAWKEFAHDFIEVLNRVENGHQATHDTPH